MYILQSSVVYARLYSTQLLVIKVLIKLQDLQQISIFLEDLQ